MALEREAILEKPQALVTSKGLQTRGIVFENFFMKENSYGVSLAKRIVNDIHTAQDATQDGWEGVIRNAQNIQNNPAAYFRQAVVNSARSIKRHEIVADKHGDRPTADEKVNIENGVVVFQGGQQINLEERVELMLLYKEVLDHIKKLPVQQRNVMALLLEGMNESEIAFSLGVKRGTVKSNIFRARKALKERLGVEKDENVLFSK